MLEIADACWRELLAPQLQGAAFAALAERIRAESVAGAEIYPAAPLVFKALELTPPSRVRAVILGQDPYHAPGQASGLSFAVPRGQRIPPSLRNIYRELERDLGIEPAAHGDLSAWARQGVLLLNSVLTVRAGEAASHAEHGWQPLTDAIIRAVSEQREGVVFMLWGRHAKQKMALVDERRHLVLTAAHPSPLSAHRGFLGCGHFSQANRYLAERGETPIEWRLAD